MQLDWPTVVLEIINFLILVWLLKRFLYQPVLNIIERRRNQITDELSQAKQTQLQAETLKQQYETRLSDWEKEKHDALIELEQQIEQERNKKLSQLNEEIEQQRIKNQSRELQQQQQWRDQAEAVALQLGSSFASRLLETLSCTELDLQLQQLFVDQLNSLPNNKLENLKNRFNDNITKVEVTSAMQLDEKRKKAIRSALEQKLQLKNCQWQFHHDPQLIAGIRVSIGAWVLQANLQDELRFFAETASHEL